MDRIRNFSIIAHIDHGKSTLADRLLELTGTVGAEHRPQLLDSMELERERGITIKAQAVRVSYRARDGETYNLHLIDTPGHVDFSYEVSRSLAACEGALLVVDAAQGVEAQTVANTYAAVEAGLELIPVLNKVDLPSAEPERVAAEITDLVGGDPDEVLRISAKTGEGVEDVLEAIVARIPPPGGFPDAPPRALIFDSEFDPYRGVVAFVRLVDGAFRKGDPIVAMQARTEAEIDEIGFFVPQMRPAPRMGAGGVGYVITGIKDVARLRVGDTLTSKAAACLRGAPRLSRGEADGLLRPVPDRHRSLRGPSRRAGPAGTERRRAVATSPRPRRRSASAFAAASWACCTWTSCASGSSANTASSCWRRRRTFATRSGSTAASTLEVRSPAEMPDPASIEEMLEPYIRATVIAPAGYVGAVMELCQGRRGTHVDMHYLSPERVQLGYDLPLAEIVLDFYDQLKSRTAGYASLDYEQTRQPRRRPRQARRAARRRAGGRPVRDRPLGRRLPGRARRWSSGFQKTIPRQLFDVPVQAAIGSRVLARETVKALRKDVTAKLYGGDVTRKRKLLEKQKAGKKRMKQVGRVEVPQEAFLSVLELDR